VVTCRPQHDSVGEEEEAKEEKSRDSNSNNDDKVYDGEWRRREEKRGSWAEATQTTWKLEQTMAEQTRLGGSGVTSRKRGTRARTWTGGRRLYWDEGTRVLGCSSGHHLAALTLEQAPGEIGFSMHARQWTLTKRPNRSNQNRQGSEL